jgi:hypothetical membrane protein
MIEVVLMPVPARNLACVLGVVIALSGILISAYLCGPGCGSGPGWDDNGAFNWRRNPISDMGVSSVSIVHKAVNVISGLLCLPFAWSMAFIRRNRLLKAGGLLFLAGISCHTLLGIFTEDYVMAHKILALGLFLLTPLGVMSIGMGFVKKNNTYFIFSMLIGTMSLAVMLLFRLAVFRENYGYAMAEYAAILLLGIWVMVTALSYRRPEF